jgi:hypothetical protein
MHSDQTGTAMATTKKPRFTNTDYAYMYLNSLFAHDRYVNWNVTNRH